MCGHFLFVKVEGQNYVAKYCNIIQEGTEDNFEKGHEVHVLQALNVYFCTFLKYTLKKKYVYF